MPHNTPPTPQQIDDALAVVHHPALVHDQPALRAMAWDTLKAARGQSVDHTRLSALQDSRRAGHLRLVVNTVIATLAAAHQRHARFADDVQPDLGGAA